MTEWIYVAHYEHCGVGFDEYISADGKKVEIQYYSPYHNGTYHPSNADMLSLTLDITGTPEIAPTPDRAEPEQPTPDNGEQQPDDGSSSGSSSPTIVLIAVGGAVLLIAVVAVALVVVKKKKSK